MRESFAFSDPRQLAAVLDVAGLALLTPVRIGQSVGMVTGFGFEPHPLRPGRDVFVVHIIGPDSYAETMVADAIMVSAGVPHIPFLGTSVALGCQCGGCVEQADMTEALRVLGLL